MWPFGKSAKARLEEAIAGQPVTAKLGLTVEVSKKTAVIAGKVPNERFEGLLKTLASGINGIDDVDLSGIVVQEPAKAGKLEDASPKPTVAAAPAAEKANVPAKEQAAAPEAPAADVASAVSVALGNAEVVAAARQKLKAEPSLQNNPVDVLLRGTTVVLRGAVDDQGEFELARKLAGSVPGVTDVDVTGLQVIEHASDLNVTDDDGDVVYTVQSGDTLSHIALHYYGSAGRGSYMKIAEANGIDDPNLIRVGQKLKIPGTTEGPSSVLS